MNLSEVDFNDLERRAKVGDAEVMVYKQDYKKAFEWAIAGIISSGEKAVDAIWDWFS